MGILFQIKLRRQKFFKYLIFHNIVSSSNILLQHYINLNCCKYNIVCLIN